MLYNCKYSHSYRTSNCTLKTQKNSWGMVYYLYMQPYASFAFLGGSTATF
jgi:hypothetical protein